ncbi:MAG: septation protein A [Gammaproteobacteria bacterium]
MKFLFDFFPILLFFAVFRYADGHQPWALGLVNSHLSGIVAGGAIAADQAPVMLATVVAIIATIIQIAWVKLKGRKVDGMLWVSFIIITVFGGLTVYFHDDTFIKWKPTIIYWVFALAMAIAQFGFRKNLVRQAMQAQLKLPDPVWDKVGLSWMVFFAVLGVLNLLMAFVVFKGNTSAWVSFKAFGITAIVFAFIVVQTLFLSKYIEVEEKA